MVNQMVKTKKVFIGLGCVFAVIIGIIAIAFYATSGLLVPVENQIYAIKRGDLNDAYAFTSRDFQQSTSFAQFQQFVNANPAFKNNKSMSFNERAIENGLGFLSGKLTAFDGSVTPIRYKLIKENENWKILSMEFLTAGITIQNDPPPTVTRSNLQLSGFYENKDLGYKINYPENWGYKQATKQSLVFFKNDNSNNSFVTLNIQVFINKSIGGYYSSYQEALDDYEDQIKQADPNAKVVERGPMSLNGVNNTVLDGKYFVIEYTNENRKIMQSQFIVQTNDKQIFYSLGYTATAADYLPNKALIGEMLKSWQQMPIAQP